MGEGILNEDLLDDLSFASDELEEGGNHVHENRSGKNKESMKYLGSMLHNLGKIDSELSKHLDLTAGLLGLFDHLGLRGLFGLLDLLGIFGFLKRYFNIITYVYYSYFFRSLNKHIFRRK